MCLLKNISIVHNFIGHIFDRFSFILHITYAVVVLLSFPISYANEHGATILTVPVTTDDFPESQEELETLLHHETGLKEPRVYTCKETPCYKKAMQLTPSQLKTHYGTSPLFSVREESATQVQLSQYSLSQAIELIEYDECQDDVSFVSVLDKKIANTLQTCNQLSSLPFQGARQSLINLLEHEPLLCPLNYEEKTTPITLPSNLWQIMLQHNAKHYKKTRKQLSCLHKRIQSTFGTARTIPTHITFLEASNKHHVEHLHQNMLHVSSIMVQAHGQQKVMLMPPISEQHPYYHVLNSKGQFLFNQEIDLSASDTVLNNESRLAYTTFYSVHLNPGDLLLVPANWFIYRKSLDTSISLSLNYLSGDTWRLFCFQAQSMQHEYLNKKKYAVKEWEKMEAQKHPDNTQNIFCACKKIQATISDPTQQTLDLHHLNITSLPSVISQIKHLKTLNLPNNKLTSFSLRGMNNLVSLNLEHNQLTSFSLHHMKNLNSLNLSNNKLRHFLSRHLPNITHLNLRYNRLSYLGQHCASSINTSQIITLDLRNNPWTDNAITHIQRDLLQQPQNNTVYFPRWVKNQGPNLCYLTINHITNHAMKYEDFIDLLSRHKISPSSENNCLTCPITHAQPGSIIFFMISKKCYKMYDADALIRWIRTHPQSITDPSTRKPLTLNNLMSADEPQILQYLKQD